MAKTDAVHAVCEAIVYVLESSMEAQKQALGFGKLNPKFAVYQPDNFVNFSMARKVTSGATVFLYRVLPNLSHRTPCGDFLPDGRREYSKLPLDLHLLVSVWGKDASTQNRLVGWVMRTLEDYPILDASLLNKSSTNSVFDQSESVELLLGEMSSEELLQVWDMLGNEDVRYQITIPYLVRNLMLDSQRTYTEGAPVQIRTLDMQRIAR